MIQLQNILMAASGLLSLTLLLFSLWNFIKTSEVIGSALDIGLAALMLSAFVQQSGLLGNIPCVGNPTAGAVRWAILAGIAAYLAVQSYKTLRQERKAVQ